MNDDFEGRETIVSLPRFEDLMKSGRKNYGNCGFLFPFQNSELLMQALSDTSFDFNGSVFSEKVTFHETTIDM